MNSGDVNEQSIHGDELTATMKIEVKKRRQEDENAIELKLQFWRNDCVKIHKN